VTDISQNMRAFLTMISHSEGTDAVTDSNGVAVDPYRVCYGKRHVIVDLSNHPAVTGEWLGESLANLGPAYIGLISTAAGRYQITKPTWVAMKDLLKLPDFSAASQDAAAIGLIRNKDALEFVQSGQVAAAISRCRGIWASLPGNDYGQPVTCFAELIRSYCGAGGSFA